MEEKVLAILAESNEELLTYTGNNMVDDDLVDSFELINIISKLEDEFNIEIDAADVTEEHFGNKDRVIALVKELAES